VEAARAHPDRFAILGRFALDQPESRRLIESWKSRPGMLGLRFTFLQPHMQSWPGDGTIDWLWPAAEQAQLPVALLATEFLPLVGQIAERHPRLRLIVDHLGARRLNKGAAAFANLPQLLALARHPNIAVKATGGPGYASDAYPFRSLHAPYKAIYDAFGPRRMFWGTDITRMPCSWKECVTHFAELPWLGARDRQLIMGEAVCDWIGWKLPA
jgi:predicted TIM-barrel fold metal-dependent hydrolase